MTNVGGRFGPFHLDRVLGEGGQSVVWAATDVRTGKQVALKLLRPGLASSNDIARLKREADLLNSFSDPGLPKGFEIHNGGEGAGIGLAMELVDGRSLASLAADGGVDTQTLLMIATEVARILSHVHSRGLVHRDVKPGNIQLRDGFRAVPTGNVVLVDFGIAKGSTSHATQHTATGASIGTIAYMAPELLLGTAAEARPTVDVYSLGVLIWSLLLGDHPAGVPMESAMSQIVLAHARARTDFVDEHRLEQLSGMAPGLGAVVAGCVQPDPTQRFRDAAEVHRGLAPIRAAQASSTYGPPNTNNLALGSPLTTDAQGYWSPVAHPPQQFTGYVPPPAHPYEPARPQVAPVAASSSATTSVSSGRRRTKWWVAAGLAVSAGLVLIVGGLAGTFWYYSPDASPAPAFEPGTKSGSREGADGAERLKNAEAEKRRAEEDKRKAEEDKRRAEDDRRRAEAEAAKAAAEAAEARRREEVARAEAEARRLRSVRVTVNLVVSARKPDGNLWDPLGDGPDPLITATINSTRQSVTGSGQDRLNVSFEFTQNLLGTDTLSFNVVDRDIDAPDPIGNFTVNYSGRPGVVRAFSNGSKLTVTFAN